MKRLPVIVLIAFVALLFGLPAVGVQAQDDPFDFAFLTSDEGWLNLTDALWGEPVTWISDSVWSDGDGWNSAVAERASDGNLIDIYYEFDQSITMSTVVLDYHMVGPNTQGYTEVWGKSIQETDWRLLDHDPFVAEGNTTVTFEQATTDYDDDWSNIDQLMIGVYAYYTPGADPVFEITNLTLTAEADISCINVNPDLDNNGEGWLTRFNTAGSFNQTDTSIMSIPGAGQIYQTGLVADTDLTYFITVAVALRPPATDGEIKVLFGGVETVLPIHTVGSEYVTLETLGITPEFDGPTEFRLTNSNLANPTIRVTFACIGTDDPLLPPPRCYFDDPDFRFDSFETDGGATHEAGLSLLGQYSIPAGGSIRSPVSLQAFTDADTDFTLKINAAAPDGLSDLTASIIDSGDDSELVAIGNYPFSSFFFTAGTAGFTLDAEAIVEGDLFIENTGDETILIGSLCLSSDAGVWPGYENPDYVNRDLLAQDCTECTFPASLVDVVAWLNWIGCVLRYLIACLLYGLVNDIWNTIQAIGSGLGLLGRWMALAITTVAEWLWIASGRLLATLLASAIPVINAIMAWFLSLPFVQDVLDAATIAGLWINGVIAFIVGVINLFVSAVRFVGVMITLVGTAWTSFISGLSAASEITVPVPDCNNSSSTFYDACLLLDVINFLASEVVAIYVLFGAVAVSILWAAGRQIKEEVEKVFEV